MLGATARLQSYDPASGEATLVIPGHLKAYANERIRDRIEQSFKQVVGRGVSLTLLPSEEAAPAAPGRPLAGPPEPRPYAVPAGTAPVPQVAARVPPEVIDAVRSAPVVRQLIEKFGGDVTLVEMIEKPDEGS